MWTFSKLCSECRRGAARGAIVMPMLGLPCALVWKQAPSCSHKSWSLLDPETQKLGFGPFIRDLLTNMEDTDTRFFLYGGHDTGVGQRGGHNKWAE